MLLAPATALGFTTAEVAQRYRVPAWRIRRVVDALGVSIPRFNRVRAIPVDLLPRIEAELRRLGCLSEEAARV